MKTGKKILNRPTRKSHNVQYETVPGAQKRDRKLLDHKQRNIYLENDNTNRKDTFNTEELDGTLRSKHIKKNYIKYMRKSMEKSCDAKSLRLCVKVCSRTNKDVCKEYNCSPNFIKLARAECASLCQKEHVNGTKYSDSDDDYIAFDTEPDDDYFG